MNDLNRATRDIVARLWNLCHILRDDGITYNEYVTELTFLLFLKMMAETGREGRLPDGYGWSALARRQGLEQLDYYRRLLLHLGDASKTRDPTVLAIFADAQTKLRKPTNLQALTVAIDRLDWYSAREEGLGQLYEGLLENSSLDYFTLNRMTPAVHALHKPPLSSVIWVWKRRSILLSQSLTSSHHSAKPSTAVSPEPLMHSLNCWMRYYAHRACRLSPSYLARRSFGGGGRASMKRSKTGNLIASNYLSTASRIYP